METGKRILHKLSRIGFEINNFVEDCITVFQLNHRCSVSLFAVMFLCCTHLYQVHTPIFLACVLSMAFQQNGRNIILKFIALMLAAACMSIQVMPVYGQEVDVFQMWNDTVDNFKSGDFNRTLSEFDFLEEQKQSANWEQLELRRLLINYFLTLMIIALSCKMHSVCAYGNFGVAVLFPSVSRFEADRDLLYLVKYLLNYTFYKFGLEICWFAVALQVTLDNSIMDIVPALMLWICITKHKTVHKYWTFLRGALIMSLVVKYMVKLSDKPLTVLYSMHDTFTIPGFNYENMPQDYITGREMLWNFLVILLVDRQMWVFHMHWEFYGGSNQEIWHLFDDQDVTNRIQDFLTSQKTYLDMLKNMFLPAFPWFVLTFILATCLYSWHLYSVMYVILCGRLLLLGSSRLYMKPIDKIMGSWKQLMYYTLLVITLKFFTITLQNLIANTLDNTNQEMWHWLSLQCPVCMEKGVKLNPFPEFARTTKMEALYLLLLLLVRRFFGSLYFLHLRIDQQARDFLDEWGAPLLQKATLEQNKKKKLVMEKVKATVENRRANVLTDQPALENALVDQGFKVVVPEGREKPYGLTEWFWSTTVAHRFNDFSLKQRLKQVKTERSYFTPEAKQPPSTGDLDLFWKDFLQHGLDEELKLTKFMQLIHSVWICFRTHSQYLPFILVFALQAFVYKSTYTLFLPLSVLYASWRFPRAPTWYWNYLLGLTFAVMLIKLPYWKQYYHFILYMFDLMPSEFASGVPAVEALLFVSILWHRSVLRPLGLWYQPLSEEIAPEHIATVDVYVGIALLEFANLVLVCINVSNFSAQQSDGGVVEYVTADNVPLPFLLIFLCHLLSMALDRILYVSAAFTWRGIFHSAIWCGVHIWLFIYVPILTEKPFGNHVSQQIYYMICCLYLLLSAYQVRNKHSRCSAVSVLCQHFTIVNYLAFMVYSKIPFFEPLRRMLDYLFTKTDLRREEFVIIESIFDAVFEVKCDRVLEYDALKNRKKSKRHHLLKRVIGLIVTLLVLLFLAAPVIYFIIDKAMTNENPPLYLNVQLSNPILGNLYTQHVSSFDVFSAKEYSDMFEIYKGSRRAKTFLSEHTHKDVYAAHLPHLSLSPWYSSQSPHLVAQQLLTATELVCVMSWEVLRSTPSLYDTGKLSGVISVPPAYLNVSMEQRSDPLARLARMVLGESSLPVEMLDVWPKYSLITKSTMPVPVRQLASVKHEDGVHNLLLSLLNVTSQDNSNISLMRTWKVAEDCSYKEYVEHVSRLPKDSKCKTLDMYLFSDHPPLFAFITGVGGLAGMYAGIVFGVWKVVCNFWSRELHEIIYDEMVNVDRVLQLCLDIYQSRITGEFDLELELGLKLINIFCSPTEIDEWTHAPDAENFRRR